MNSHLTQSFLACFSRLPNGVKSSARKSYRLWKQDPYHPGLHFKRVHTRKNVYGVRVGLGWRALGVLTGDTIIWFWIGSHAEYEELLTRL